MKIFYTKLQSKISKTAGSSSSLPEFDNPTFEDALRRIECDTASDELLIKQANMKDFLYAYSDAIDESFEKEAEQGRDNRNTEIALDMLADNEPLEKIVKYSHLSKETVLELQKKRNQQGRQIARNEKGWALSPAFKILYR